jgi:hypothetical protein
MRSVAGNTTGGLIAHIIVVPVMEAGGCRVPMSGHAPRDFALSMNWITSSLPQQGGANLECQELFQFVCHGGERR